MGRSGGVRMPGDDLLLSRLSLAKHFARGEIAAPDERLGCGLVHALAARARFALRIRCVLRVDLAQQIGLGALFIGERELLREFVEMRAARVRERIFAVVAHFDFRRQHRAKRFADRREVVAADPVAQLDEVRRQRRKRVHHLGDFPDCRCCGGGSARAAGRHGVPDRWRLRRFGEHHANHRAAPERHHHAAPDEWLAIELPASDCGSA